MSWKTSYRVSGSTQWADISAFEITFKLKSYPTNIDEGTTVVITSSMKFCNFKSCPLNTTRNEVDTETISARWDLQHYSDISRAHLPKSTYFNSCVWPAGLYHIFPEQNHFTRRIHKNTIRNFKVIHVHKQNQLKQKLAEAETAWAVWLVLFIAN